MARWSHDRHGLMLLVLLGLISLMEASSSSVINIDKDSFDLGKLCGKRSVASGMYIYDLDLCSELPDCGGSLCQFRPPKRFVSTINSKSDGATWSYLDSSKPELGIQRVTKDGEHCAHGAPRISTLKMTCDAAVQPAEAVLEVDNDTGPSCKGEGYSFKLASACSCLGGCSKMSTSLKLFYGITLLVVVYLIAGCCWNKSRHGTPLGLESLPNKDFWLDLPLYVQGAVSTVRDSLASRNNEKGREIEKAGLLSAAETDDILEDM